MQKLDRLMLGADDIGLFYKINEIIDEINKINAHLRMREIKQNGKPRKKQADKKD